MNKELNQKITQGAKERNTYLAERDYARQEITRLQKESQEYKARAEHWQRETNTLANKLDINNQTELDQLLQRKTLKQIVQEKEKAEKKERNTQIVHQTYNYP